MDFDTWLKDTMEMSDEEIAAMRADIDEQMLLWDDLTGAKTRARRRYRYANREYRNFQSYQAYKGNTRRFKEAYRMKNAKRGKRVTQSLVALW